MYWLLHRELLGIFHNSVSKCYVVYLRHTVLTVFIFTGEFIDYTDTVVPLL